MRTDIDQHGKVDTYLSSYQKAIDCVERALGELAEAESLVAEFAQYTLPDASENERFYSMRRTKETVEAQCKKELSRSFDLSIFYVWYPQCSVQHSINFDIRASMGVLVFRPGCLQRISM